MKKRKMLTKKIETLTALENESEELLYNVVDLREDFKTESSKFFKKKFELELQELLNNEVQVEAKVVAPETIRMINELAKKVQHKTRNAAKLKKKIEEAIAQKEELSRQIDKKLDTIANLLRTGGFK